MFVHGLCGDVSGVLARSHAHGTGQAMPATARPRPLLHCHCCPFSILCASSNDDAHRKRTNALQTNGRRASAFWHWQSSRKAARSLRAVAFLLQRNGDGFGRTGCASGAFGNADRFRRGAIILHRSESVITRWILIVRDFY